ncbi:hypothetical protein C8R44DRAFT_879567 [Mycena epipterygia]|nr:hypothetical protein C8R44DRAFT_879567 [Mycena epipterygia]
MSFSKSLLTTVCAAMLIGTANAFTSTANLGFFGTTNCAFPAFSGPFAIAIPAELVGSAVCCSTQVTLTVNGETITAVFSSTYDASAGSQDIALSPSAFAALDRRPQDTSVAAVTWSFI